MSKSAAEAPRMKKLKVCSPSPSPCELSSLPDDIILNCLARVSRSDHASLSLVSKWHHSKVCSSNDLYEVRSLMGFSENFIYVCLRIPPEPKPRWFTLRRRVLVPIPSHLYQPPEESSVVALGCGIYVIGGRVNGRPSSRVFFLDCRTHSWSSLASMGVARASAAAGVVDGKIYVLGGCEDPDSSRWGEVFDPKTQIWERLPMPPDRIPVMYASAVMEEKVFALNESGLGLFYIPSQGIWKKGNSDDVSRMRSGWYAIENVMYSCVSWGRIHWCEAEEFECRTPQPKVINWREVMGLESLQLTLQDSQLVNHGGRLLGSTFCPGKDGWPELLNDEWYFPGFTVSNSGSNMLLFWDQLVPPGKLEIWCAEISLKRRNERSEIWGKVEWSGPVMALQIPLKRQQFVAEN